MLLPVRRVFGFISGPLRIAALAVTLCAALLAAGCAPKGLSAYQDPCTAMKLEVKEKQELDAKVKALAKQSETYRKQGDTASAAAAEQRLAGLRETQRLLKESLDQSGNECRSVYGDPLPVRGPAAQDPERRDPLR